jgi:hypothetical protein
VIEVSHGEGKAGGFFDIPPLSGIFIKYRIARFWLPVAIAFDRQSTNKLAPRFTRMTARAIALLTAPVR